MIAYGRDDAHRLRHTLVDVRKLCAAFGLLKGAKPQARGLLVLCPWHAEKHASCSVTLGPDGTVRTHCFTCQVSGDALALIARVRELDVKTQFRQVLAEAARIAGSEPVRRYEPAPNPERSTLDAASYSAVAARLLELCSLEKERDVLVQALLRDFEPATLELAGLVRKGQGLIFPFHRLIIPWRGLDASIDVLQRRRVDDDEPKKKYVLPPRRRPFYPFGAEQLGPDTAERDVTFVEGAIDGLALRVLARRDRILILPLGIPGVGAWRKEWAVLAKGRAVRIAFDADAAGERNVAAVARDLRAAGATRVRRWTPTAAKDWAGCLESGAA